MLMSDFTCTLTIYSCFKGNKDDKQTVNKKYLKFYKSFETPLKIK